MHREEWVCRKCCPTFPCRKVIVEHKDVYYDLSPAEKKHCISPFSDGTRDADFVKFKGLIL